MRKITFDAHLMEVKESENEIVEFVVSMREEWGFNYVTCYATGEAAEQLQSSIVTDMSLRITGHFTITKNKDIQVSVSTIRR